MALGSRKSERQEAWVGTTDLPRGPAHVFYDKLNALFAEHGKLLERLRSEYVEGTLAHMCEPGAAR